MQTQPSNLNVFAAMAVSSRNELVSVKSDRKVAVSMAVSGFKEAELNAKKFGSSKFQKMGSHGRKLIVEIKATT